MRTFHTYPPPSGDSEGNVTKQYARIFKHIRNSLPDENSEKISYLNETLSIVTSHLTFVHLKLNDASAATKIFERLNFRGVKVGIVDLVRNEIFSSLAEDPGEAQRIFDHVWNPFEKRFEERSEAFFFPYCLIQNSNVKKSELFSQLRLSWNGLSPEAMVNHMVPYQEPFLTIDRTGSFPGFPEVSVRLDRLVRMRRPSSVYPYVMSLLMALKDESCSVEQSLDLLDSLESFLVRRAIVGFEPTGLHALFKGLWEQLDEYSSAKFREIVALKPTIQWPSDNELTEAIVKRPIAKTNICNYLMVEFDMSLPGDDPPSLPTIEHILPQEYKEGSPWADVFTKEKHKSLKDTWANLLPLSSPLNSSLQASAYSVKQPRYRDESMFETPRRVADAWTDWNESSIGQRATELAEWAIGRWPHTV